MGEDGEARGLFYIFRLVGEGGERKPIHRSERKNVNELEKLRLTKLIIIIVQHYFS